MSAAVSVSFAAKHSHHSAASNNSLMPTPGGVFGEFVAFLVRRGIAQSFSSFQADWSRCKSASAASPRSPNFNSLVCPSGVGLLKQTTLSLLPVSETPTRTRRPSVKVIVFPEKVADICSNAASAKGTMGEQGPAADPSLVFVSSFMPRHYSQLVASQDYSCLRRSIPYWERDQTRLFLMGSLRSSLA